MPILLFNFIEQKVYNLKGLFNALITPIFDLIGILILFSQSQKIYFVIKSVIAF